MTRGYFPDRVFPPVNSLALSVAIPDILAYTQPIVSDILNRVRGVGFERSRCATHSVVSLVQLRPLRSGTEVHILGAAFG